MFFCATVERFKKAGRSRNLNRKGGQTNVILGGSLLAINENNGCVHLAFLTFKWNTVHIGPRSKFQLLRQMERTNNVKGPQNKSKQVLQSLFTNSHYYFKPLAFK